MGCPVIRLLTGTREALAAEAWGPAALGRVLGVRVPEDWPPDLHGAETVAYTLDRLTEHPAEEGWWLHYFVGEEATGPVVVGCGGFCGPPVNGVAQLGYSVLRRYRRRGYATAATCAMVGKAFADSRVRVVLAETLPELVASIGVLDRCGFRHSGPGEEEGTLRFELHRDTWADAPPPTPGGGGGAAGGVG
ncbi:MAG TPA: GNAT family N-acetyltransferase [Longimicrobiales bacterium]|nr:GNAT family N-acetyltransferase [Longimicrobiales bacterium]